MPRTAIVYAGPGVSLTPGDTVEAIERVAVLAGFEVRRFIQLDPGSMNPKLVESIQGLAAGGELDPNILAQAHLYLAPGSDEGRSRFGGSFLRPARNNYATYNLMKAAGYDQMLKKAIEGGLGYVGICAGAYLGANADGLDLANCNEEWATGAGESVVTVSATLPGGQVKSLTLPLLDGPKFDTTGNRIGVVMSVAQFIRPAHAPPVAAVTFARGLGKAFLSGPHPEAPDADPGWDPHGNASWRAPGAAATNHQFLAAWMNAVARP
jgi:hypothetical protein